MASYSYTNQGPWGAGGTITGAQATAVDQGAKDASTFKLDKDGSVANTGTQDFNRTLSGADKVFATFTATDGKQYSMFERNSDKAFVIKNVTDNVILLELTPTQAGVKIAGGVPITQGGGGGFANHTIGVGPIGSRPAAGNKGAVYIETPFS